MIALDVEHALHALGVGEGRRVQKYELEGALLRRARPYSIDPCSRKQPFATIGALESMPCWLEPVKRKILRRPVEIPI